MTTRSKQFLLETDSHYDKVYSDENVLDESDIDSRGNIEGFIDYDMEEDPEALDELRKLINYKSITESSKQKKLKKKKKKKKKNKGTHDEKLNNVFMNYLILKATENANIQLKGRNKKKIKVVEESIENNSIVNVTNEDTLNLDLEEDIEDTTGSEDLEDTEDTEDTTGSEDLEEDTTGSEDLEEDTEDTTGSEDLEEDTADIELEDNISSDEEYSFEYDKYDEELEEIIDNHASLNSEEHTMEYFHNLEQDERKTLIEETKEIYSMNDSQVPLRFKIINSCMDIKTKSVAIENIDKLSEMDVSTGEHSKMDHWINGLIKIPFGKYRNLPVKSDSSIEDKKIFIKETYKTLNNAIYGHNEAKTHILQVIGKWIKNPHSGGNVLAIQGPMGNGKTTLVKEGISKVLNRPFAFIALGGASDSAYFDGHCYTYEGSHWGRIVQILQDSRCMNPIIYFDELDKISDTQKGDEIVHMLTHLTDTSQNSLFQDNYFPGVNLDLSKALFIFSYNDESRVNKILKDRMYVIHTKGFKTEEKLKISREYLLPDIMKTFVFENKDIIFTDEILKEIVDKYTLGEEGVRNLKRCIETIISKINIYLLSDGDDDLSFKIKDFSLPFQIKSEHLDEFLKIGQGDKPPSHMYM